MTTDYRSAASRWVAAIAILALAGCGTSGGAGVSTATATATVTATPTPEPSPTEPEQAMSDDERAELFYLASLRSAASTEDVDLGGAENDELAKAGRHTCETFDMGASLKLAAASLALEDYLPRDDMDDLAFSLIAMAAAAELCPEHREAAGLPPA